MINHNSFGSEDDLASKSFGEGSDSDSFSDKSMEKQKLNNEKSKQEQEFNDLIKCYICLNPAKSPVICRFCGNIACKQCFYKWLYTCNHCGYCRKKISHNDLISPPILSKIQDFLKGFQDTNNEQCIEHKEKFLFFCVTCLKKYCGKCLSFYNEESKNHIGHKIIDYAEIRKSKYFSLLNELDSAKDTINEIDSNSKICENYKTENKIKYIHSMSALDRFKDMIVSKYEEKTNLIDTYKEVLTNLKKEINDKYKYICENLKKIDEIGKPIENFNIENNEKDLKINMNKVNDIMNQIDLFQNKNNQMQFETLNFSVFKSKKEILDSDVYEIIIESPIYIKIKLLEDKDYFSFKIKNINKNLTLIPLIMFKKKFYEFNRIKPKEKNNKKEKEKTDTYKALIKVFELNEEQNEFHFIIYKLSIY